MSSGNRSGGEARPHLGLDRRGLVVACSHDLELLQCSQVSSVDGAQAILWLRRGAEQNQGPPVVLLLQVAGLGRLRLGSAATACKGNDDSVWSSKRSPGLFFCRGTL
jgi:hypothetical protein